MANQMAVQNAVAYVGLMHIKTARTNSARSQCVYLLFDFIAIIEDLAEGNG